MLRNFVRFLEFSFATFCLLMPFCIVTRRSSVGCRTWLRSFPVILLSTALLMFLYRRLGRTDLNDSVDFIIEDDFIYRHALLEPHAVSSMASLKAGITVNIAMTLVYVARDPQASANAKDTITWIVVYSSAPVHFHILSDKGSVDVIDTIMKRAGRQANCRFSFTVQTVDEVFDHLLDHLLTNVPQLKLDMIREHVATRMLALILPWHFPKLQRLIWLSNRIKLRADIVELYEYFDRFNSDQVMGLTLAQGGQFAAAFAVHRHVQAESTLGLSPPFGWPGFNTEVMLLDLAKMRSSLLMTRYIDLETQFPLLKRYDFNTRQLLPELDEWLTLVGAEKPTLFYTIPCQWNVQQILDSDAFEYCRSDIKAMEFDWGHLHNT